MSDSVGGPRVAFMAPMKPELRPLLSMVPLRRVDADAGPVPSHTGTIGDVEIVAAKTGIGMQPARDVTAALLDAVDVDHVVVVGVAGGIGPTVDIGDLVVPEVVIDGPSGKEFRPQHFGDVTPKGTIVSSDQFGYEPDELQRFIADGVVGLDMETAAVAEVCEARGVPWTAFRAISDRGDDDTVDPAVLEMAGADGSGYLGAVARYLLRRPWKIVHLSRLAKGSNLATKAAARAAVNAVNANWTGAK